MVVVDKKGKALFVERQMKLPSLKNSMQGAANQVEEHLPSGTWIRTTLEFQIAS